MPSRTTMEFDVTGNRANWRAIEWAPDGKVRCRYRSWSDRVIPNLYVDIETPSGLRRKQLSPWVRVRGQCDLDGDGRRANWWMDLDPKQVYSSSEHRVLRPNASTANQNRF